LFVGEKFVGELFGEKVVITFAQKIIGGLIYWTLASPNVN